MPRGMRARENALRARAKRQGALDRVELRGPSEPRQSAAGATSAPIKTTDPETTRLIADALARREIANG